MSENTLTINIRKAREQDLHALVNIESQCFPVAEAADECQFKDRLAIFRDCFWIAELKDIPIGFINGMVIDGTVIEDKMYVDAHMHRPNGAWQSVFGLDVLPEYRCRGYAAQLMEALIDSARQSGRKGCVLTCKDHMVHYYERFGYKNMGISASKHGHAKWNDMILEF